MSWEYILGWIELHPGLAYWVQAIGSIGAIIGAFSVSAIQLRSYEKQRRSDVQEKAEAFYAVIKNAVENSIGIGDLVEKSPPDFVFRTAWAMYLGDLIRTSLDGMKGIPVHELGTYERVSFYGVILGGIYKLQYEAEVYLASDPEMEITLATYESIRVQSGIIKHGWNEFQKHSLPLGLKRKKGK